MTIIKAGTTSTTGFVVDTDASGTLILQSGGSNTAVAFDSQTQQAVFTHPISQPGGFMFRNKLINGSMAIDQRNAGAAQTITAAAALAYTIDRWYAYCTGANVTGQRIAGSGDTEYRYRFTGAASVTKIGFAQRIEATNSYDLNGSTATLSVDLANSLLTTVTWTAWYANTADTFGTLASSTRTQIATGTFTVNSTVTRYSTQITIPSSAKTGIEIEFSVGAQTSGTWTIGNVQLERGSAATPFEQRPIGLELSMCQRYFYRWSSSSAAFQILSNATVISTTEIDSNFNFPVTMRVTPTAVFSASSNFFADNGTSLSSASVALIDAYSTGGCIRFSGLSGLTTNQARKIRASSTSAFINFSSEL